MAYYHPEALKYFSNIGAVFLFRFAAECLYFSSSSAISYLAAFNYTTSKMDAQYKDLLIKAKILLKPIVAPAEQ